MRPLLLVLVTLFLTACSSSTSQSTLPAPRDTPMTVGQRVPDTVLRTIDDQPMEFSALYADRPVVITFYRGGWCPYCNQALTEWDTHLSDITAMGADFVAITPERPDLAAATASKNSTHFPIYSDADGSAARMLGIAFTLDEDLQTRYRGYKVDLSTINASGQWALPHPATFIIDQTGTIRYAHVNPDYAKGRAKPEEVLAVLSGLN